MKQAIRYGLYQMTYQENILSVYRAASDSDLVTGRLWYRTAREIASQVGKGDYKKGAGIIAALSPIIPWKENISLAFRVVKTGKFSGHFSSNCNKARRIYQGEDPEKVLGGRKVIAFYRNIVTGGDTNEVTVDRHALSIAYGRTASDQERTQLGNRPVLHRAIVKAYQDVALDLGISASDLQAITWVAWRRMKGITE